MTAMRGDVVNRIKRLPKPSKVAEALQPLFEAVSNATHAVEEAFLALWTERGRIEVTITKIKICTLDPRRGLALPLRPGLTRARRTWPCDDPTLGTSAQTPLGGGQISRRLWPRTGGPGSYAKSSAFKKRKDPLEWVASPRP
jgi:hypothetical protein